MILHHYSDKPLTKVLSVRQNRESLHTYSKPTGLWVSVEGEQDWVAWCESEGFRDINKQLDHLITLADGANILVLSNAEMIDDFTHTYGRDTGFRAPGIAWQDVAEKHSGIIIAPYIWSRRLHHFTSWYYGWDCASGCIWDASAVASIAQVERADA